MKRIFLALLAALPAAAFAQNPLSYFSLGPVVGVGGSWISQWPGDNENSTFISGGLDLTYSRDEHFGWGVDLTVAREGFDARYDISGLNRNLEVTPVYLRLQPKAIYFFNNFGDALRPKVWIGPSFGLLLDETSDLTPDRPITPENEDQELGQRVFDRLDLGFTGGLGVNLRIARGIAFRVVSDDIGALERIHRVGVSAGRRHLRAPARERRDVLDEE